MAATKSEPMLSLIFRLDMPVVREILSQQEFLQHAQEVETRGMAIGTSSSELLDACLRLVNLLETPQDAGFLSGLILREVIYRILRSPQGRHLRAIATLGNRVIARQKWWSG